MADLRATFIGNPGSKISFINPEPIQNNDIVCVIESGEPDPKLAIRTIEVGVVVSIWHKAREGSTSPLEMRTDYHTLLQSLIGEVRFVIDVFKNVV